MGMGNNGMGSRNGMGNNGMSSRNGMMNLGFGYMCLELGLEEES